MIVRDKYGIIIQHPVDANSCADSLSRTAIMAICGSGRDERLLAEFVDTEGEPVRHPYTKPFCYYKGNDTGMSRDQMTCLMSAFAYLKQYPVRAEAVRRRHWLFVNKDFLAPDIKWIYAKAANHWSQYLWCLVGIPWAFLGVVWASTVDTEHELNQLICECAAAGTWLLKLLCKWHPDWQRNVEAYWGARPEDHGYWRGQPEIAEAIVKFVKGRTS